MSGSGSGQREGRGLQGQGKGHGDCVLGYGTESWGQRLCQHLGDRVTVSEQGPRMRKLSTEKNLHSENFPHIPVCEYVNTGSLPFLLWEPLIFPCGDWSTFSVIENRLVRACQPCLLSGFGHFSHISLCCACVYMCVLCILMASLCVCVHVFMCLCVRVCALLVFVHVFALHVFVGGALGFVCGCVCTCIWFVCVYTWECETPFLLTLLAQNSS